jgi:hypothetical protein
VRVLLSHEATFHKYVIFCVLTSRKCLDWHHFSRENAAPSYRICNIRVQSCAEDGGSMFLQNFCVIYIRKYVIKTQEITLWIILVVNIRTFRIKKICVITQNGNSMWITTVIAVWIINRLFNDILKLNSLDYMASCRMMSDLWLIVIDNGMNDQDFWHVTPCGSRHFEGTYLLYIEE